MQILLTGLLALLAGVAGEVSAREEVHDATPSIGLATTKIAMDAVGSCLPLVPGVVLWLPAEDNATDLYGHTTSFSGASYATGEVDRAFNFNGTNEVSVDSDLDLNLPEFSIEGWIYPTSLDGTMDVIVSKETGTGANEYQYGLAIKGPLNQPNFGIPVGNLAFRLGGIADLLTDFDGWVDVNQAVPLNKWSHVALTVSPAAIFVYLNGQAETIIDRPLGTVPATQGSLRLGAPSPATSGLHPEDRFNGRIDEFAVYHRALSHQEITRIFNAGELGKCGRNFRVEIYGNHFAQLHEPFFQQIRFLDQGGAAGDISVTTTLPPDTTVQLFEPGVGTVDLRGNQLVWHIGPVTGPTNHILNLQLISTSSGSIQLRAELGYLTDELDNTEDDSFSTKVTFLDNADCIELPGIVARWRAENNVLDSVGSNHGILLNLSTASYYTNGQSCQAFYFAGQCRGGAALIPSAPELEMQDGDDFTLDAWIRVDTGAKAYTGNLVLLDHRTLPFDKFKLNPDGSLGHDEEGRIIKEGELSVGYLFSLFREGNAENGLWLLECQINSRERFAAGLVNTNHHSTTALTPQLENPSLPVQPWHHVAVSIHRSSTNGGRFYVDGRPSGTFDPTPYAGDLTPPADVPVRLGLHARGLCNYQYQGGIDDLAIYRRALTDDEVRASFEAGREAACCRNVGISITNPPTVGPSVPFDARIRVSKTFGHPPKSIIVTNILPPGINFLSATPQIGTVTNIGQLVIWNVGNLGIDESVSLRLRLSSASTNTYRLLSSLTYSGGADDNPDDDHAESVLKASGVLLCHIPDGLLGWWPGNSSPQDIVSTNNGTIVGTVGYDRAVVRSGFIFDGVTSAVRVGNPVTFHVQDLTLEAWIRRGSVTRATASGSGGFLFASDTGGYGFGLLDDGRLMLSQVGLSFVPSTRGILDTVDWHHVAVTKAGTNVVFYIDGNVVTRTNLSGHFSFNRPFALGALGGTTRNVFLGGIDDLSLYGRALSDGEIHEIFAANSQGKCRTGLIDDQIPESPSDCFIKFYRDEFGVDPLIFLTLADQAVELQVSTNLVNWVTVRRIANAAGEIRGLINPTNQSLFYRACKGALPP